MPGEVNWLASGQRPAGDGEKIHQASGHPVCLLTSKALLGKRTRGQFRKGFICMAVHLSLRFINNRGRWPLFPLRCNNNVWMILQHQLSPCSHLKGWESRAERVSPVLLNANDAPSLPDQVFFFSWVSQIIGCRFIDLIFFSAYNNMKYVPCKEQAPESVTSL